MSAPSAALHDKIAYINLSVEWDMNLGQRIKLARQAHRPKMTQTQLAEAVGVSQASVAAWESGETKNLSGPNLLKAGEVLGVSPEWLDCGVGPGPGEAQRAVLQRQPNLEKDVVELALTIQALPQPRRDALKQIVKFIAEEK